MRKNRLDHLIHLLKAQGIQDERVLEALRAVPRHLFVDEALSHQAYDNVALPIGFQQTISQPFVVAKMSELLALSGQERVLEVGTGSGYQTAILAHLVKRVYSIERIKHLKWQAKKRLNALGLYHVTLKHGDGAQGWQSQAPFDAIIVTAAAQSIPQALMAQLRVQGRLIAPVGDKDLQHLILVKRTETGFERQVIEAVRFVPLIAGDIE